jgi:hypothetical protein
MESMTPPITVRPAPVVAGLLCVLALYGVSLAIARSLLLEQSPELVGTAVFLDLVVTSTVCHWLLGVRLGGLPPWTVVPLAGLGLTLSHFILPDSVVDGGALPLMLAAGVEGAALLLVAVRIRTVARGFRAARSAGADAFGALEAGLLALGAYAAPVARWARLELELWWLAFAGWLLRPRAPAGSTTFSHHREPGWSALAAVLTLLMLIEGALLHLWLDSAGLELVKWLVCAAHAYGLIWIVGDAQALRLGRSWLEAGAEPSLHVRVGVRGRGRFALSDISGVQVGSWDSAVSGEQMLRVSGPANLRISFRREVLLATALAAPVPIRALLLQVDEPARLAALLSEHSRPAGGARA